MNPYLEQIRECVLSILGDEDVSIALFGSSSEGRGGRGSDVDVAVIPNGPWDERKLVLLRERLEELSIPCTVDLVDFSSVSETFRKEALRSAVWWKITEKVE